MRSFVRRSLAWGARRSCCGDQRAEAVRRRRPGRLIRLWRRRTLDQTAPAQTVYATAAGSVTLACEGTGAVPVVLLAGLIDPITTWDDFVQRLGPDVLTCRYDPIVPGPPTAPITPSSRCERFGGSTVGIGPDGTVRSRRPFAGRVHHASVRRGSSGDGRCRGSSSIRRHPMRLTRWRRVFRP